MTHDEVLMYSFPQGKDDRYDLAKSGTFYIDFTNGTFQTPDGKIREEFTGFQDLKGHVESLLLFVSDADTEIIIGDNRMIADHKLWHLFQGMPLSKIQLKFPSNKLPDLFDVAFVVSNQPYMPYAPDLTLAHTKKTNTKAAIGLAFTEIFRLHLGGYDNFLFKIKETGGVNAMDWEVRVSNDDVTYDVLTGVTFTQIAAGGKNIFETNKKWHFYQVVAKAAVGTVDALIDATAVR